MAEDLEENIFWSLTTLITSVNLYEFLTIHSISSISVYW
jgi:hypothetical protein